MMRSILYTFILDKKYFTLDFLNARVKCYEFGSTENSNIPQKINKNKLKTKLILNMSGSEMLCLVRYFGNEKCWRLYILLHSHTHIQKNHGSK